jgi:hypothetical protein
MKNQAVKRVLSARALAARLCCITALLVTAAMITFGIAPQDAAQAAPSLARFMPHGAIVCLEAKDFGELLREWNASRVKSEWLGSENYQAFANSRLFLRLGEARAEFASAAGIPADSQFLSQAAGSRSAIGIYDIGELHFLFISKIDSTAAMQSALWQSRAKFEPRSAGGAPFFVKKDDASGRVVAFALKDDHLLLATQEELLAGALEAMNGGAEPKLGDEAWFSAAIGAAHEPGDLRLVMNLSELAKSPHFRSYWIQRNVSDLRQYSAAVSDVYREGGGFREERILVREGTPASDAAGGSAEQAAALDGEQAASALALSAPKNVGMWRVMANPTADEVAALLSEKLLAPRQAALPASTEEPEVGVTNGVTGSSDDLETRIDAPFSEHAEHTEELTAALLKLVQSSGVDAVLEAQSTERDPASDFVRMDSVVVLVAKSDWEVDTVQEALAGATASLSTSQLGLAWRSEKRASGDGLCLDGQFPLCFAVDGKYLAIANTPELLGTLALGATPSEKTEAINFSARIDFARERTDFLVLARAIDGATFARGRTQADDDISPLNASRRGPTGFLAGNAGSLLRVLRGIGSESIVRRHSADKLFETVTYQLDR